MVFFHGEIKTFKDLIDEIFYDWGMAFNVTQQINKTKNGYWINKTEIFTDEDLDGNTCWFLSYKTTTFKITNEVMNQFKTFFDFYDQDLEFNSCLFGIEDNFNKNDFIINNDQISIGKCVFYKGEDFKYFMKENSQNPIEIKKTTYQKILTFSQMISRSK